MPTFDFGMHISTSEFSMVAMDCAVWRWCPCDGDTDWMHCSMQASVCEAAENNGPECGGDGTWEFVCGDESIGPPCITGRFYGEGVVICRCPTDPEQSSTSLYEPEISVGEWSCSGAPPGPFPWFVDWGPYSPGGYVPDILFADDPPGPGAKGAWTWCPCSGEVQMSNSIGDCPFPGNCDSDSAGPGEWLFRGGSSDLGPPPIVGRFYGETVFIGFCCQDETSTEMSSYVPETSDSCSMPEFPFFWWDMDLELIPEGWNDDGAGCGLDGICGGWIWCPCNEAADPCAITYPSNPTCPFPGTSTQIDPGEWLPYEGGEDPGPPPIKGRFYGELVYYCACEVQESVSVSSSSSFAADCACELSGLEVTGNMSPNVTGIYNVGGWYNGQLYYTSCDVPGYYIVFDDDPFSPSWWLQDTPPGTPYDTYAWQMYVVAIGDPPTGSYSNYGAGSGDATVDCCSNCLTDCSNCQSTATLSISGLSGSICSGMNGNISLAKTGSGTDCYYFATNFPSTCIQASYWLTCDCGAWVVSIQGSSCGPGFDKEPGWTSEPREPSGASRCPPTGAYTMHISIDDCPSQIPTVSVSFP